MTTMRSSRSFIVGAEHGAEATIGAHFCHGVNKEEGRSEQEKKDSCLILRFLDSSDGHKNHYDEVVCLRSTDDDKQLNLYTH